MLQQTCRKGSVIFRSRAPAQQQERHAFINSTALWEVATLRADMTACLLFAKRAKDFGTEEQCIVG